MDQSSFNDKIRQLESMGFEPESCSVALQQANGNLDNAINMLLQPTSPPLANDGALQATASTNLSPYNNMSDAQPRQSSLRIVHGPLSQYSIENGRSACTCIALKAAEQLLQDITGVVAEESRIENIDIDQRVNASFLQNIIVEGVEICNNLKVVDPSMEHKSAEEVLMLGCFPTLTQDGPVQQGVLSHNQNDPLGLYALLQSSQSDVEWFCVLITKPPETVLVALPPIQGRKTSKDGQSLLPYMLVDSHPRPQQFGAQEAYVRFHESLASLVHDSLERIFPFTSLGPDIPSLMAAMYNQFDLYRFRASRRTDQSQNKSMNNRHDNDSSSDIAEKSAMGQQMECKNDEHNEKYTKVHTMDRATDSGIFENQTVSKNKRKGDHSPTHEDTAGGESAKTLSPDDCLREVNSNCQNPPVVKGSSTPDDSLPHQNEPTNKTNAAEMQEWEFIDSPPPPPAANPPADEASFHDSNENKTNTDDISL